MEALKSKKKLRSKKERKPKLQELGVHSGESSSSIEIATDAVEDVANSESEILNQQNAARSSVPQQTDLLENKRIAPTAPISTIASAPEITRDRSSPSDVGSFVEVSRSESPTLTLAVTPEKSRHAVKSPLSSGRVYPRLNSETAESEPGEDFSLLREVDHLYPTLVPIEIGQESKSNTEDGNQLAAEYVQSIDVCEEAVGVPTAPLTVDESGDYFSMQSLRESLFRIQGINKTEAIQEEEPQIELIRPAVESGVRGLYRNFILESKETAIDKFLRTSSNGAVSDFELWELLNNYLRVCNQLTACEKSVLSLSHQCGEYEKQVWTLATKTLTQLGACNDRNTVTGTYTVHTANLNNVALSQLRKVLKDTKDVCQDSYPLYTYSVQLCKLQINHFLFKSFHHVNVQNLNIPGFTTTYPSIEIQKHAELLRKCISTIFSYIRRPNIHGNFFHDCQVWIEQLVGLLLRVATVEDHIFLLNHVLRSPPGVPSKWASKFVQIPSIPIPHGPEEYIQNSFSHAHLDYALLVLSCLLNPVRQRQEFLTFKVNNTFSTNTAAPDSSLSWVVVDSDGEDEIEDCSSFRENDLAALLNQVPFESIFARVVFVCKQGTEYVFATQILTDHNVLKMLAFFNQLVDVMGAGLVTYTQDRYKRLTKLLGRLILHSTQYVTDFNEMYLLANPAKNPTVSREYDIFINRALTVLLRGAAQGTLQFVASVPFGTISIQMLWEIYAAITKWDIYNQNETWSEDIPSDFEQQLIKLPESDAFYILTTIANMAIAREGKDNGFVRIVTTHLFQIGFLSPVTRDSCSKHARDLLGNVTRKFPHLISFLLQSMKTKMDILRNLSLYLLKELAFSYWKPQESDLKLLSYWIVDFDPNSLENHMGRFMVQSMNWNFDDNGNLFLPVGTHRQIALCIVEAFMKWEKSTNTMVESVKLASGLTWRYSEFSFVEWGWEVIKRLHLHVYDQPNDGNLGLTKFLRNLPTFEGCIDLEPLRKSIQLKQPFGSFVAVLMTPYGHSLPLVGSHGWALMETMISGLKFEFVIEALFFVTPLFANSRHCVAELKSKTFLAIITAVLGADQTYYNAAKNLISSNFPGNNTKRFGEMISAQYNQCYRFGITEYTIVRLWVEVLTSLDGWNKDMNILYLLDIVSQLSISNEDCKKYFADFFIKLYEKIPGENQQSIVAYVFGWNVCPSLLPNASYPYFPFLTHVLFSLEMDIENTTGFWKSVCQSLSQPKESLESAVKRACVSTKYSTSVNYLSIFRFAQQAIDMKVEHPLILVFLQKFFVRFFHRISANGVGERFFEGMINTAFLKKLKRKIHDLKTYYENALREFTDAVQDSKPGESTFAANPALCFESHKQRLLLVNAMALWIEDVQLHKDSLYLPALPPQFLPHKLILLLEGYTGDWDDLLDNDVVQEFTNSSMKTYLRSMHRSCWFEPYRGSRSPDWLLKDGNRELQLSKRIESYDAPLKPPELPVFNQVLPICKIQQTSDPIVVVGGVKQRLKMLTDFAKNFSLRVSQHTAVDCTFLELLPELYANHKAEAVVNVKCSGGKNWQPCTGPAPLLFRFTEARLNERVGHLIQCNRTEYQQLLNEKSLQPPPPQICIAAVFVEDIITNLVMCLRMAGSDDRKDRVITAGKKLFYDIVGALNDDSSFYPPTRQMFSSFLEILGSEFISNDPDQYDNLIRICVNNAAAVGAVATHINLVNCEAEHLINIYNLVATIARANTDLAFVLLSKLDLRKWLAQVRPSKSDRSRLISIVWMVLISDGPVPNDSFLLIHGCCRNHLQILLLHDFPAHFIEILQLLITGSGQQLASLELWFDLINTLSNQEVHFSSSMDAFLKQNYLQRFGTEKCIIPYESLLQTIRIISKEFTKERLTNGLYGLYPKYRLYIEPINLFIHAISYALVSSVAKQNVGQPIHEAITKAWTSLRELYAPWILPYDQKMILQHGSNWIQEMNFDTSSAMHPWTVTDAQYGCLFMSSFCESITFFADTIPGASVILSTVLSFYIDHYAMAGIKEHVLGIVNNCLVNLMPWSLFWPSVSDVEAMNRIVEQYLPGSHAFIGCIVVQVDWPEWILNTCTASVDPALSAKINFLVINLIVRLANDSVAKELTSWKEVIEKVQTINWEPLPANAIEAIMNWYVMSVDPRVVLPEDKCHPTEYLTFSLLKAACLLGFETRDYRYSSQEQVKRKRYLWIRTYVRLVISVASKFKQYLQTEVKKFEKSIQAVLTDIVEVARAEEQSESEVLELLKELFGLLSNHYLGTITRNALIEWCDGNRDVPLPVLYSFINCGFDSKVPAYTIVPFAEKVIRACFRHTDSSWESIMREMATRFEITNWNSYYEVASKDGHFLTLNCLLLINFNNFTTMGAGKAAAFLSESTKIMKLKTENEAVLPLISGLLLKLAAMLLSAATAETTTQVAKFLSHYAKQLSSWGEDSSGWGILDALGLGQQARLSVNAKLYCRCLSGFLSSQLKGSTSVRTKAASSENEALEHQKAITPSLDSLEILRQNRQYSDLQECIEFASAFIQDDSKYFSLDHIEEYNGRLTCFLFTETFVNIK